MRIGPFAILDFEGIKELLETKKLTYSVFIDQAAEKQILKKFNQTAEFSPRSSAGRLQLSILYFDIEDSDFEKIQVDLEKYGIVPISDGSYELGGDPEEN